jgi:hypothetical protein
MNSILILLTLLFNFSCQNDNTFSKEQLIGKWISRDKNYSSIVLKITKDKIYRYENNQQIVYTNYSISKDTLLMSNSKFKEKHIIKKLTKNELRFGPLNPYEKDIELLDFVIFMKK